MNLVEKWRREAERMESGVCIVTSRSDLLRQCADDLEAWLEGVYAISLRGDDDKEIKAYVLEEETSE